MFIPDPDNPGKYKLSKSHNIKYQYDSSEGKHIETPNEPSLVEEIEAAFEEDIEEEKSKDVAFMENYKWVIVSLMGMILILGAGFSLGFTTININKAMEYNNNTNSKKKNTDKKTHIFDLLFSKFQSNESIIKNRHKTIATIIFELQMHANDCMLLNVDNRYKNKKERENLYLEMLDKNEIQQDKNTFEKQLCENVIGIKWPAIDLTDFDIDDISDTHWDFSKYINDIKNNEIQLKFPPPFDTMRYGEAKKKKLMWIYSNKHLEWFQVVMTFNNTLQRIEDLNLVAIRLRFKEYFCYPMLNKNGTTDIKKWIIETRKYEPRVEHLRRLRRHVTYYKKKWWNGVDPSKYELDVDDGIIEYYGRNIFDENIYKNDINKKDIKNKNEGNDDDLIKMVQALEKKFERNRKLKQAEGLNDMNSSMQMDT